MQPSPGGHPGLYWLNAKSPVHRGQQDVAFLQRHSSTQENENSQVAKKLGSKGVPGRNGFAVGMAVCDIGP